MPGQYREGQTATNPKTGQTIVYRGGKWVAAPAAPAAPGAPVPQRKLSPQETKALTEMNNAAADAQSVIRDYDEADRATKRLGTGPWRGSLLDAAIPVDDGGIADTLGAWTIGALGRVTGAIDDEDVKAYSTMRRVQARRVLAQQTQQKGVQTEGDAARIKAGDISARLPESSNAEASARGRLEAQIVIDRANFMTQWANRYGLNGVNERGQTATQVFNAIAEAKRKKAGAPAAQAGGQPPRKPTIKRIR